MSDGTVTEKRPGVDVDTAAAVEKEKSRGRARTRLRKTYKLYIGGAFPRSESGRTDPALGVGGDILAQVCRASRKDVRDAVTAARAAQPRWAARSAYNRAQILYRCAEVLEGRSAQLEAELSSMGAAPAEVTAAVDRLVYYAGWCDKYQQIFSSVNPVASSHFNFSILEPVGVVSVLAPEQSPLLGLVSVIAPIIAGGNTCVALASSTRPLSAVTLAEVVHASDVPAGVLNLLTGRRHELREHLAGHMDVSSLLVCSSDVEERGAVEAAAVHNLKRVVVDERSDWDAEDAETPYAILAFQEIKTIWHPVGT